MYVYWKFLCGVILYDNHSGQVVCRVVYIGNLRLIVVPVCRVWADMMCVNVFRYPMGSDIDQRILHQFVDVNIQNSDLSVI